MILWVLRVLFIVLAASIGLIWGEIEGIPMFLGSYYWPLPLTLGLAALVVVTDVVIKRKRIDVISSVYFGLIVGVFLSFIAMLALEPYLSQLFVDNPGMQSSVRSASSLTLGVLLCYITTSVIIQTKDDFRFIVPYVEFARQVKGQRPYVLDTSVIIDGRIADVVESGALDNKLLVPRFVLSELQGIADSSDKIRRGRGRRGLDILNRLRSNKEVDMAIYEREHSEFADEPVDQKLVQLAKLLEGKIITNDYNLNKVAKLHSVQVLNLNDLANSLKPIYLPGERFKVRIIRPGEGPGQGVGYLDDGTMIVVEDGRDHVNKEVTVSVTSVLQTSAGRMIFSNMSQKKDD